MHSKEGREDADHKDTAVWVQLSFPGWPSLLVPKTPQDFHTSVPLLTMWSTPGVLSAVLPCSPQVPSQMPSPKGSLFGYPSQLEIISPPSEPPSFLPIPSLPPSPASPSLDVMLKRDNVLENSLSARRHFPDMRAYKSSELIKKE